MEDDTKENRNGASITESGERIFTDSCKEHFLLRNCLLNMIKTRFMKILYFGPISKKGQASIGGYEAANRKNIDGLLKRGIKVVEFPNPVINRYWGNLGKIAYVKLFLLPLNLWRYRNEKDVMLHITPLYGNLLVPALFTVCVAKKLGIPVLVDIRAGSLIYYYQTKGERYQHQMRGMLNRADVLTVEGSAYIQQIKSIIGVDKPIYYFPNLANVSNLPIINKPMDKLNILYFGRLTKAKGLDIVIDTIKMLDDRFKLYVAGTFGRDYNEGMLDDDKIVYLGFLNPSELQQVLADMHFFIFPTKHIGEGQSNSLIEAMSAGLIPVVSAQGFNEEVTGNHGVVIPLDGTAIDYKNAILRLVSGDMVKMSLACQNHICEYHNADVEIAKLITIYRSLLCQ